MSDPAHLPYPLPPPTPGASIPKYLRAQDRWVFWRTITVTDRKTRRKRKTKAPFAYHDGKTPCDAHEPRNWTDYARVAAAMVRAPGAWNGPGFDLGIIAALNEVVIGIDLDTCLDADGGLATWAIDFLTVLPSYAEVSPSDTGIKIIARIRLADLPEVRRLLDIPEGEREQARTVTFGERTNGQHAPSAQLFLMRRFFAITGNRWGHSPGDVELLSLDQIAALAALFGPKPATVNTRRRAGRVNHSHATAPGDTQDGGDGEGADDDAPLDETALRAKLASAFLSNPRLKERWEGGTQGLTDTTRSGRDMSMLALLVAADFTKAEVRAALHLFDHGKLAEEEARIGDRYFDQMWRRTAATPPPAPPVGWEAAHPNAGDTPPPPPEDGDGSDDTVPPDPAGRATGARPDEPTELPVIKCVAGQLDRMYREAEAALINAGMPIFQRSMLVRPTSVEFDAAPPSGSDVPRKTHSAILIAVTAPALTKMLSRAAIFVRLDKRRKEEDAWVICDPPPKLVDIILASRGEWRFPTVRGILTCPTLRADGSVLKDQGYDPISRYYLSLPSDLVLPDDFPDNPTREDAEASLGRLDALLDGYAFEDDPGHEGVSRACALAMLMTQTLRCAMPVSPLEAVSAKAPGTGKSHLADLCSAIPTGRWCPIINAGKDDNETEKGINTKLISGISAFSIDNVHKTLNLEALNTATERPLLSPRDFGVLKDIEVENGTVIRQTGNNLDVVDEQVRRTTYCRMDAKIEQPEQRAFTSDPIQTVLANRNRYVADVLIVARAYHLHGWRPNIPPYGGYGAWSHFVREPLCWLGQPDPILSQDYMRKNDPAANRRTSIIEAWHAAFGMGAKTVAEAVAYATTPPIHGGHDYDDSDADKAAKLVAYQAHRACQEQLLATLREAFPAGGREGINAHGFGNWLRRFEGRLTAGLKFVKAANPAQGGVARWKLSH